VLVACYSCDKGASSTVALDAGYSGAGWTVTQVAGTGTTGYAGVAWKVAEGGDQLRFNSNVGEQFSAIVHRFKERSTVNVVAGTYATASTAPNPPSNTAGAGDWDWLAFAMSSPADPAEPVQSTFTGYPAGYDEEVTLAGTANNPSIATALKRESASPEDPGAFTTSLSVPSIAFTVAVQ
jgi:hypothetical protein